MRLGWQEVKPQYRKRHGSESATDSSSLGYLNQSRRGGIPRLSCPLDSRRQRCIGSMGGACR